MQYLQSVIRPVAIANSRVTSDNVIMSEERASDHNLQQLLQELKRKDDIIAAKDEVIVSLKRMVERLEGEVGQLEEEKREMKLQMSLVREEASRSLTSMVEAQQDRRREEEVYRERKEQLEVQVVSQARELGHLREQLAEEAQAHREDVAESERRARDQRRRLEAQLRRAKAMGKSVSQPNISSIGQSNHTPLPLLSLLLPRSPRVEVTRVRAHQPLLNTLSEDLPSYQQSVAHSTSTMPRSPYQRAPATFHTGVTAFHGHLCYFSSFMMRQIHVYDTALGAWQLLPTCPVSNFGLEIVNNMVTTIGGRLATGTPSTCTAKLFSLSRPNGRNGDGGRAEQWAEKAPPMTIARSQVATASNSRLVIVVGGEIGDYKTFIADIEVLLLETNTWFRVGGSPLGNYSSLSAMLCEERLYLVEGCGVRERDRAHSLHTGALVESIRETSSTAHSKRSQLPWRKIKPVPVSHTTCTCSRGKLLAVGGINGNGQSTNEIWEYVEGGDRWKTIGNLKTFRYRSLVGVTATGSLLVIGGLTKTKLTNCMEIFDAF